MFLFCSNTPMSAALTTAGLSTRPDPLQDRPGAGADTPNRFGRLGGLVRRLIDYGKEFAAALRDPDPVVNAVAVAKDYGIIDFALILLRVTRGLMRAAALEAKLLRLAARRERAAPTPRAGAPPRTTHAAGTAQHRSRASDPPLTRLPSEDEVAAEVLRRPIGAMIADICRDLAIFPAHPLWGELHDAMLDHGGNPARLFADMIKRRMKLLGVVSWPGGGSPSPAVNPLLAARYPLVAAVEGVLLEAFSWVAGSVRLPAAALLLPDVRPLLPAALPLLPTASSPSPAASSPSPAASSPSPAASPPLPAIDVPLCAGSPSWAAASPPSPAASPPLPELPAGSPALAAASRSLPASFAALPAASPSLSVECPPLPAASPALPVSTRAALARSSMLAVWSRLLPAAALPPAAPLPSPAASGAGPPWR